jgi:hypothetical protein
MVRHRKNAFFAGDPQKVADYFAEIAKQYGLPFGKEERSPCATDVPRGAFISHSYQDESGLQHLLALLPSDFDPTLYPSIKVLPTEFVSTPLIKAVRAAPALVYLAEGPSVSSDWVVVERDIALRAGKPVFAFYPSTGTFRRDYAKPKSLIVQGIYALRDQPIAEELINWMAVNRGFNVAPFPHSEYTRMSEFASDIMDFSAMFLAITGKNTVHELPMEYIRLALEDDEGNRVWRRLMIACLDPGAWIPKSIEQYVVPDGKIDLTDDGNTLPWSANRLDDIYVRIVRLL